MYHQIVAHDDQLPDDFMAAVLASARKRLRIRSGNIPGGWDMFKFANLEELAKVVQRVITPEVVSGGTIRKLNDDQRRKIRLAMFAPGSFHGRIASASVPEQRELLSQFTNMVAGPISELLPPSTAAFAVLVLYEEFVNAVFIQPVWEADVGGEN